MAQASAHIQARLEYAFTAGFPLLQRLKSGLGGWGLEFQGDCRHLPGSRAAQHAAAGVGFRRSGIGAALDQRGNSAVLL
jgi:hypothetical protein